MINTSQLRFGGAVQVALSFIQECRRHDQHEYHIVLGPGVDGLLDKADFPDSFHFYRKGFGIMKMSNLLKVQREMAAIETLVRPDCVVTTSGPAYWRSQAPHLMGFNLPLYIYHESPYLQTLQYRTKTRVIARKWLHCHYFRRDADALIVQTDDVNRRVRCLLGTEEVYTVSNNCNAWYDNPVRYPPRLPAKRKENFRLLSLTSYYPHKNLELIPRVIDELPASLRSRVEFVLTLTEDEYRKRIGTVIPPQIQLIGPVPPPECPSLYMECDAMFLPTLAECFSASYPEAMKMEKPILTSDLGFARSICRDAALYFTPCDVRSAARAVERLVEDPELKNRLCKRGRKRLDRLDTPARRAERILEICEHLSHQR